MYRNKYGNKKTEINGIKFDSKKEAKRYTELIELEQQGSVMNLELQPRFTLIDKYVNGSGEKVRALTYIADFKYLTDKGVVIEDVKGMKTDVYKIKKKMFEKLYYPMIIKEI